MRAAHIEPMRGTPQQSKIYCSKEDPNPFEFGICPMPKTAPLDNAITQLRDGMTVPQIARIDHAGSRAVAIHGRNLMFLHSCLSVPRDYAKPPCILWCHGPTGAGKTRCCYELGLALQDGESPFSVPDHELRWFDGYHGQKVALIDDLRAKKLSFGFLLRLLDRYPMPVPIKGGFVQWNPDVICITTPCDPENTFVTRALHKPEDIRQLTRRIEERGRVFDFHNATAVQEFADFTAPMLHVSATGLDTEGDSRASLSEESLISTIQRRGADMGGGVGGESLEGLFPLLSITSLDSGEGDYSFGL